MVLINVSSTESNCSFFLQRMYRFECITEIQEEGPKAWAWVQVNRELEHLGWDKSWDGRHLFPAIKST